MFNRQYLKASAKTAYVGQDGDCDCGGRHRGLSLLGPGRTGTVTGRWRFEDGQAYFGPGEFFNYPLVSFAVLIIGALAALYYILVGNVITIGLKGWLFWYWRGKARPVSDVSRVLARIISSFVTTRAAYGCLRVFVVPAVHNTGDCDGLRGTAWPITSSASTRICRARPGRWSSAGGFHTVQSAGSFVFD